VLDIYVRKVVLGAKFDHVFLSISIAGTNIQVHRMMALPFEQFTYHVTICWVWNYHSKTKARI